MDVRTIEEAVLAFYRSGNRQQEDTHQWLQQIQESPQAWSFCWELMQLNKPSEVQFFGAITLHSKLTKHWAEVPKEAHNEFKQKLLESIVLFGNGPKIVLCRLCISVGLRERGLGKRCFAEIVFVISDECFHRTHAGTSDRD